MEGPALAAPLLDGRGKRGARGGTTWAQTLGNIVVSIVGTGVLGLPYAFRMAGWLAGSLGVFAAGVSTYLCMLLLVQCRNKLEEDSNVATAYGDDTKDIITLNLPNDWSAISVKVGLCVALAFTFPIMMHPIYEIIEMKLSSIGWFEKLRLNARAERLGHQAARVLVLVAVAVVASCIPGFGAFISLVGSTVCALLSFVLPATFHLLLVGSEVQLWQRAMDYFIIAFGLAFAAYGTYDALSDHRLGS
ncbi:hypothetical protein HPP92_027666 [Vanilla planifolia]|uniref:Amino acid transporter transmembrane domain-containing protein n=1 Tax=Vanilla planifolia TaxID=51239 RepID=A0A835U572_VANPL|nr:hypothetical protein HPP92_027666 [Vanilla planifolia]